MIEEPKPINEDHLPKATHQGEMEFMGQKIKTYRLDDGRAIIDAEDFNKILESMGLVE